MGSEMCIRDRPDRVAKDGPIGRSVDIVLFASHGPDTGCREKVQAHRSYKLENGMAERQTDLWPCGDRFE